MHRALIPYAIVSIISSILGISDAACQNTISFDNLQPYPGRVFSMDVILTNGDTICGMQIPIALDSIDVPVECDSAKFNGLRCQNFGILHFETRNDPKAFYIYVSKDGSAEEDNAPLYPGVGAICRLYFSFSTDPRGHELKIYKGFLIDGFRNLRFLLWTPQAIEVQGSFLPFRRNF